MRPESPRIAPLSKDKQSAEQKEILAPLAERGAENYNIFTTLINNPEATRHFLPWATYVLDKVTLSARDRELLILRVGWNCQAKYEWAQHKVIGQFAGLSMEEIERLKGPANDPAWSELDQLYIQAADELTSDHCVTDETWAALSKHLDQNQIMDVVFIVGQYTMVCMALNSFGIQLDEGLEGF